MIHLRKPSSKFYSSHIPSSRHNEPIFRGKLNRRSIVYGCTILVVVLFLSTFLTGMPDGAGIVTPWSKEGRHPLPPIEHTLSSTYDSTLTSYRQPVEKEGTQTVSSPEQSSSPLSGIPQTRDGFPLISTSNNSSLVLLTGVTGSSPFPDVPESYSMIFHNRLDYVDSHGI